MKWKQSSMLQVLAWVMAEEDGRWSWRHPSSEQIRELWMIDMSG
jgi:hypothetical protein